jgi:hypothetical protein
MAPADVEIFVKQLEALGLVFLRSGAAIDMAVVDQLSGPLVRSAWLEFGHVDMPYGRIAACRFAGNTENTVITPEGWRFAESLSATYAFVPAGAEGKSLEFLRHEEGLDVYFNRLTGKEAYIGRTKNWADLASRSRRSGDSR